MMLSSSMIELDMSSSMMDGVAVLMPPPPPLLMQRKHICCPCLKIKIIVELAFCKIILIHMDKLAYIFYLNPFAIIYENVTRAITKK
jgi:hypothetical protein